ncbi:LOW QUALITY PROTEIN: uncharacterized protein ACR2FA_012615 [Aphomia sociella]
MKSMVVFFALAAVACGSYVPLAQPPHHPAIVLDPHGRPLDTAEVISARAIHHQAKALEGHYAPVVAAPLAHSVVSPIAHSVVAPAVVAAPAAAVSHQSRVDVRTSPAVVSHAVAAPVVTGYAAPLLGHSAYGLAGHSAYGLAGHSAYGLAGHSAYGLAGHGHLLKKRSLGHYGYAAPIIAPSAVSHQSRVDVISSPAVVSHAIAAPVVSHAVAVAPSAVSHQSRVDVRTSPAVIATAAVAPLAHSVYAAAPVAHSVYAAPLRIPVTTILAPLPMAGKKLIMNRCLELAYFPKLWKQAFIKAIPKSNRTDYSNLSSFRPIGLLNLFGKLRKKLMNKRLIYDMTANSTSNHKQFGFKEQTSTVDAIRNALNTIYAAKHKRKHAIAISLDIIAAFDYAWWPAILTHLKRINCPLNIYELTKSYHQDCTVIMQFDNETATKTLTRGCIQGSVYGPTFWNLTLDELLETQRPDQCHLQAFADDPVGHVQQVGVQCAENSRLTGTTSFLPTDIQLQRPAKPSHMLHPHLRKPISITEATTADDMVGAAYVAYYHGRKSINKIKLHGCCSVFQAELVAIREACKYINLHPDPATIISDSNDLVRQKTQTTTTMKSMVVFFALAAVACGSYVPLAQPPHYPAIVLDPHGRPLDTAEVISARAIHHQAKALEGHYAPVVAAPLAHSVVAPIAHSVVAPTVVAAPLLGHSAYGLAGHSAYGLAGHGHLLKKRSLAHYGYAAPVIAPSAVSHQSRVDVVSSPAVVSHAVAAPVISHAVAAPVVAVAPSAVSHQSRVDVRTSPAVIATAAVAPLAHSVYAAAPVAHSVYAALAHSGYYHSSPLAHGW